MKLNKTQRDQFRKWFESSGLSLREAASLFHTKSHVSVKKWIYDEDAGIHVDTWNDYISPVIFTDETEKESRIPSELKDSYEALKTIMEDKNLFWVTEQNLRNTASIVRDKNSKEPPKKTINFEVEHGALPYIRQKVAAGNGIEILEERYNKRPDMHIMDVHGESMMPTYLDGQQLIAQLFQERIVFGQEHLPVEIVKNMIPEDSVIIYDLNDGGLAMKRVKYKKNKNSWYFILHADNEDWSEYNKFPKIIRKKDDFVIYGKVIGVSK